MMSRLCSLVPSLCLLSATLALCPQAAQAAALDGPKKNYSTVEEVAPKTEPRRKRWWQRATAVTSPAWLATEDC